MDKRSFLKRAYSFASLAFLLHYLPSKTTAQNKTENARSSSTLGRNLLSSEPKTWMCLICGWIYDEAYGDPEHGIAPGTRWADVPENWSCPECGARKMDFEMIVI